MIARRHDEVAYTAYEKCVDGLVRVLKDHKRRLRHVPEWRQGVDRNSIAPLSIEPDVSCAVADGDYAAFRQATQGYDAKVRADVCRWVEKHPAAREGVGRLFTIADAVEEVFLTAFEGMSDRPREVTFEAWLTNLIAPAVRSLLHDNVSELQAVSLARTLRGVAATREGM